MLAVAVTLRKECQRRKYSQFQGWECVWKLCGGDFTKAASNSSIGFVSSCTTVCG